MTLKQQAFRTRIYCLLSARNQGVSFIPGGIIRFYQLIGITINKPFKGALCGTYIKYFNSIWNNNIKLCRTMLIKIICETWYNKIIITKHIIYINFITTCLINKLD